ncbi:uncharacterized protein LOC125500553 [Athalia rosae]|uniref:uncharacterized protein LOC125500553 n=1 Tax=Athalia rosae TaxID=37344 RepID=UPI0006258C00|nr:uncharacterized protein LOC125500553 [Athalia rosae]
MQSSPLGRGRGVIREMTSTNCSCCRPYSHILCKACGFVGWGRIKSNCPKHRQTVFLIDISQCPHCTAYGFMMEEF